MGKLMPLAQSHHDMDIANFLDQVHIFGWGHWGLSGEQVRTLTSKP